MSPKLSPWEFVYEYVNVYRFAVYVGKFPAPYVPVLVRVNIHDLPASPWPQKSVYEYGYVDRFAMYGGKSLFSSS